MLPQKQYWQGYSYIWYSVPLSTLAWRDKARMVHKHKHSHTDTQSLNLQNNRLAVKQCRHNQNGKPGWEPSIQLSGRNDNNTTVFGSRGRLRQTRGEEGTPTLWRLFFKVWQLLPTSDLGLYMSLNVYLPHSFNPKSAVFPSSLYMWIKMYTHIILSVHVWVIQDIRGLSTSSYEYACMHEHA